MSGILLQNEVLWIDELMYFCGCFYLIKTITSQYIQSEPDSSWNTSTQWYGIQVNSLGITTPPHTYPSVPVQPTTVTTPIWNNCYLISSATSHTTVGVSEATAYIFLRVVYIEYVELLPVQITRHYFFFTKEEGCCKEMLFQEKEGVAYSEDNYAFIYQSTETVSHIIYNSHN